MAKVLMACLMSAGLHGFLLTQWPSPWVQVPRWSSSEPITVIYVPTAKPPEPPGPARPISLLRTPSPPRPAVIEPPAPAGAASRAVPAGTPATPLRPPAPPPDTSPRLLAPPEGARLHYKALVRERLKRAIAYPGELGDAGTGAGAVLLRMTINRVGQVLAVTYEASDAPIFEQAVTAGLAVAGRFPQFPQDLSTATVTYEFLVKFTPGTDPSVSP